MDYFPKFFRNLIQAVQIYCGVESFGKIVFAQASAPIASANTKKSKWQIFGPNNLRAKNQNFRNPANYIPLDPEFYAYHYSQEEYTLKSNWKRYLPQCVTTFKNTVCGTKIIIFKIFLLCGKQFWWTSSFKSGSSGVLIEKLENVPKYLLTS